MVELAPAIRSDFFLRIRWIWLSYYHLYKQEDRCPDYMHIWMKLRQLRFGETDRISKNMLNPSIFVKVKCTFVSSFKIFLFSLWTGGNIDISDFGYIWSEVPLYQKCHLFLSYVANLEVKCFSFKTFERRHAAASQFVINKQSAKDRWLGYCLVSFWMYKHHGIGFSTLRPRQNVCSALL